MLKLFLFLFLSAIALTGFGHNGYLSGIVQDKSTREPLDGGNIYIREISAGTVTDIFGRFQLTLKPGVYTVEISYLGFTTKIFKQEIREHETALLNVELESGAVELSDLIITSGPVSNSTNHLSRMDVALRAVNSSQEVLRMVPGLFIAQHGGGGKAEQIFLRGFDVDHGTDINISVDGMPVNMVSHAHGQGYSDLHFLIPETIGTIDFEKGPYYADKGNFATAGFVGFNTFNTLEQNTVKVEGGSFGAFRNVNLVKLFDRQDSSSHEQISVASEFFRSDGYFESPQGFVRRNGMIKYFNRIDDRRMLSISASRFTSGWSASGQIPERAVANGTITRFGAIDNGEGGKTSRFNVNASLTNNLSSGILRQQAYASQYKFDLLSNFTFFLNDPANGDRIQQSESRILAGYNIEYLSDKTLHNVDISQLFGGGFRLDAVDDIALSRVRNSDVTISPVSLGELNEQNVFGFVDYRFSFAGKFAVTAGLRYDRFFFDYTDALTNNHRQTAERGIISPKASLEYDVTALTRLFVKAGYGFHSNDTRSILSGAADEVLPRAAGVDIGAQWKPFPKLFLQTSLWTLALEQELVYVGDEGIVEPSGKTDRKGIELSLRYQLSSSFYADADLNYTIARNRFSGDNARYIPLAPSLTTVGGILFKNKNLNASLRYRYLADRPANEDYSLTAEGYLLLDATTSYSTGMITFRISAENLLNNEWKEAQFETTSRLKDEPEPVTEIHFTPGSPLAIKASVEIKF
jgi:hypothetical protein